MAALTKERIAVEQQLLSRYFKGFKIQDPGGAEELGVVGKLQTNSGNEYGLWIPLGDSEFPNAPPKMYVVEPKDLRKRPKHPWKKGKKLAKLGTSHAMHLLDPDEHGHPQICHYRDDVWSPNVTLYKVVMKGRFWLEAYEFHRRTGKDIDTYLPHM